MKPYPQKKHFTPLVLVGLGLGKHPRMSTSKTGHRYSNHGRNLLFVAALACTSALAASNPFFASPKTIIDYGLITQTANARPFGVAAGDFDGDGKTDSTEQSPQSFVFATPGAYEASVEVKDADGQTARGTRRIVAFGDAQIPDWKYGVTAHLERRRAGYYPTLQDVTHAAELMQAAGIQAARIDFNWDMLNPEKDVWRFDDYDAMVKIVRAHDVDILALAEGVRRTMVLNTWKTGLAVLVTFGLAGTGAVVVLVADALSRTTPGSGIFRAQRLPFGLAVHDGPCGCRRSSYATGAPS